jgi:hypothetical protein
MKRFLLFMAVLGSCNPSSHKGEGAGTSPELGTPANLTANRTDAPAMVGPREDALIIGGTAFCNPGWSAKDLKNNSSDKFLTITIQKTTTISSGRPTIETIVFRKLAPQEQRPLGCAGCGSIATGRLCEGYDVVGAVYENP